MPRTALVVASAACFATACSLLVDLHDLAGSGAADANASGADGSAPSGSDGSSGSDAASPDGAPTPDGGSDAAAGYFLDDFNRADGPPGNGWLEKTPGVFSITGHRLSIQKAVPNYLNDGLYRPMSEALLNVEVSVVFSLAATPPGYPQIHARVPATGISTKDSSDGYAIYVPNTTTEARIFRQNGSAATDLQSIALSQPLVTGVSYRLRFRAVGTNPVSLEGWVEVLEAGAFKIIGHATFSDAAAERFDQPGTVSVSADTNAHTSYDDFTRTPL